MYEFLDRLINIALPKIREFKGLNILSFDKKSNLSFGISDYSIFPEIDEVPSENNFGMNITICISAIQPLYKASYCLDI